MNIFSEVKKLLSSKTSASITLNSKFTELGLDSLDLVDLIVQAEKKYKIEIEDENLMKIVYVKDLVNLLSSLNKKE